GRKLEGGKSMISVNNLKTRLTIVVDANPWQVIEFKHVKTGRGTASFRSKLRNLPTGNIKEKTSPPREKVDLAQAEHRDMQYLYAAGDTHAFMDTSTYEQIELQTSQIEHELQFIKENMEVSVIFYEGDILGIDLPSNVELKVVETEPGIKGDTVSGGSKPATLETGLVVQVPLFIDRGETLVINTSDGKYISRA